jgi:hypothetical protein
MILGRGLRLHVKLGHMTLRKIAMNATAASLDEAERSRSAGGRTVQFAHFVYIEWGCRAS